MNRRNFLSFTGLISGGCLIPAPLAGQIAERCIGKGEPLIIAPPEPGAILYAVKGWDTQYTLKLGSLDEPSPPTLREYLEEQGWSLDFEASIREYLQEQKEIDDEELKERLRAGETLQDMVGDLDDPISGYALDNWYDQMAASEGPEALAYHYLAELPLDDRAGAEGDELGELSFTEGDRPGSNLTFVEAPNLATLACLQHRLNELNQSIRIEIC